MRNWNMNIMDKQEYSIPRQAWWSWRDVIMHAPKLGIPHFQRGNVWDFANRVALLESMYHESPCGSIVIWRQGNNEDADKIGVSLVDYMPTSNGEIGWIVDGQQRLRTLIEIYSTVLTADAATLSGDHNYLQMGGSVVVADADSEGDRSDAEVGDSDNRQKKGGVQNWYVCVPAVPEIRLNPKELEKPWSDWAHQPNVIRSSIFRTFHTSKPGTVQDPRSATFNVPGLLPLGLFLADDHTAMLPDLAVETELAKCLEDPGNPVHLELLRKRIPWGPLFITSNPHKKWEDIADPNAVKPLAYLLGNPRMRAVLVKLAGVFQGRRFAVDSLPDCGIKDAIGAYVRINRAGVRVRAEERAMAALAARDRDLLGRLAVFVQKRDDDPSKVFDRTMLAHSAEKSFGFSLWMGTVARYAMLRCRPQSALLWTAPQDVERVTIVDALDRWPDDRYGQNQSVDLMLAETAEQTTEALVLIDSLMSRELYLDHRMARPPTASCMPIVEALSRIPAATIREINSDPGARRKIARLLHLTLLHPYLDRADQEYIITAIHRPFESHENSWSYAPAESGIAALMGCWLTALHAIDNREATRGQVLLPADTDPERLYADLAKVSLDYYRRLVNDSRSLQHSAVGWLYALERRAMAACEFNWEEQAKANAGDNQAGIPVGNIPTDKRCLPLSARALDVDGRMWAPEKQHVVPFSAARKITDKGGTRATASPANDIGNLTWLSERQNGFEHGFSDRWAALVEGAERANLGSRGFLHQSSATNRRALDCYQELYSLKASSPKELFNEFCGIRREWMVAQMAEWLGEWGT